MDQYVKQCCATKADPDRQRAFARGAVGGDVGHLVNQENRRNPEADRNREDYECRIELGTLQPGGAGDRDDAECNADCRFTDADRSQPNRAQGIQHAESDAGQPEVENHDAFHQQQREPGDCGQRQQADAEPRHLAGAHDAGLDEA